MERARREMKKGGNRERRVEKCEKPGRKNVVMFCGDCVKNGRESTNGGVCRVWL